MNYICKVKKIDRYKRQRYEISIKIIELEDKMAKGMISKKEEKEIEILKQMQEKLDKKIND